MKVVKTRYDANEGRNNANRKKKERRYNALKFVIKGMKGVITCLKGIISRMKGVLTLLKGVITQKRRNNVNKRL